MSIVTVFLEKPLHSSSMRALEDALHHEALHNPEFSGAEFCIGFDEATWVDCPDEVAGASLLRSTIMPLLESQK